MMVRIFVIISSAVLLTISCSFISRAEDDLQNVYLKKLLLIAKSPVSSDSCELSSKVRTAEGYLVSDFLVDYINTLIERKDDARTSFQCQTGSPATCHISYGGGTKTESWERLLVFNVDSATKEIVEESFRCVDVP